MKPYLASKELGEHVLILGPRHPTILTDLLETSEKVKDTNDLNSCKWQKHFQNIVPVNLLDGTTRLPGERNFMSVRKGSCVTGK